MQSAVKKRSVWVGGRRTCISLEDEFWQALNNIAKKRKITMAQLLGSIASQQNEKHLRPNLSSAVRIFVLGHSQEK
jgi:predicted DNA-binding ribbon-helix-helix protein